MQSELYKQLLEILSIADSPDPEQMKKATQFLVKDNTKNDQFYQLLIQAVVDQWEIEQQQGSLVETGYRVGTTVDKCVDAWESCMMSDDDRRKHDRAVLERFTKYLTI